MPSDLYNINRTQTFAVRDYDLGATLSSGQAFRWRRSGDGWLGVIGSNSVYLQQNSSSIIAETAAPVPDWNWLTHYLQLDLNLNEVLNTFPTDAPMQTATQACRGLRLLRQDPWETLASFILSSTKQIVQIQQIVGLLTERFGEKLPAPPHHTSPFSFPAPARIASATESELRDCKMGFRAPNLLKTARLVAGGKMNLEALRNFSAADARAQLIELPGVGRKIADCVLLFAYGFQTAFPIDVWVMKALQQLYFPRRKVKIKRLHHFAATHFGPWSGYAQQYLFHYMRTRANAAPRIAPTTKRKIS